MSIQKAVTFTDGNHINMQIPLMKIDKENRIVEGFACLDNIDQQGDIVTAEAAYEAFDTFRGNIREMHQPIAVGKMLSFRQAPYYDDASKKTYNGIWVEVHVSKGAEATWEKVLDGTLSGFSIGALANSDDIITKFEPDLKKNVRIVKKMRMGELSLVDSPANQFANILTIKKNDDGYEFSGMVADASLKNVFWCDKDRISLTTKSDTLDCLDCGQTMENIGFVEDTENLQQQHSDLAAVVTKFLDPGQVANEDNIVDNNTENMQKHDEGGASVSDTTNAAEGQTEAVENKADENAENTEGATEVQTTEQAAAATPITIDQVREVVSETVGQAVAEAVQAALSKSVQTPENNDANSDGSDDKVVADNSETVPSDDTTNKAAQQGDADADASAEADGADADADNASGDLNKALQPFFDTVNELVKAVNKLTESSVKQEERIDEVVKATAIKKSGDVESQEKIEKNEDLWGGHFRIDSIHEITNVS